MPPTKSSVAWQFFTINADNNKLVCKLCSLSYCKSGSTTTLVNHLKNKHIIEYSEAVAANPVTFQNVRSAVNVVNLITQPVVPNVSQPILSTEAPAKRLKQMRLTIPGKINQKAGDDALMNMIILDMQPIQIVENDGFKKYSRILNSDYVLPSRKVLTRMLEEKYEMHSAEAKAKLTFVENIAITTDIWSSDSQKSFLSATAHFIKDSKLNSLVIATIELRENHTSQNISNGLKSVLIEWQIFDKVDIVVTDNAPNMKKAITLFLNKKNLSCVAHTLNLVVKNCLDKDKENCELLIAITKASE
ncbi:zinc finger BED domain-containing protein 1-like [Ctenocephalides felis]|uniref:zinc finger BED domain-containing protein 1-like n=1 Tax=Ctenocephalides felis TaxID=7515 RepID=UPI000E6E1155|nr:zinc finger BED domain-containing protein 1-like [Ctenocephalides felis]